jgi:predicted nucleic acid-binding protein
MTTSLDSNILVALLDVRAEENGDAEAALYAASESSDLVIAGPVYGELRASRNYSEPELDSFLADTGVRVDWVLDEPIWRVAGSAYRDFAERRRRSKFQGPRPILTDFLIGAHALVNGYTLLTLDQRHYKAAFPKLKLQKI